MTTIEQLRAALADRYRVERELGAGGMATVFLAHDLKHDRDVAIKVLKSEVASAIGAERFLSEIKVTANLQHPNLLPLFDSGSADGLLFYVMPYIEGETLRARLQRESQLPVDETIRLVSLIANALDFAHARGVIHRDLKPDNILLQAGQPVVADFGIALALSNAGGERVTQTGLSLGTPHYMSPEQAAGERGVDARSDQFALGALTYEMLTGEPPHTGATAQVIIARIMSETPRAIRSVRPAVATGVDDAVQRALAKSPADRFASCGEFVRALSAGAAEERGDLRGNMRDTLRRVENDNGAIDSAPISSKRFGLYAIGGIAAGLAMLSAVVWFTARFNDSPKSSVVFGADLIAVMPLGAASDTSLTRLGQDLAVTISANLDGVGALRSIDAATLLMRARKLPSPIPDADAQQLAKELGARSVLTGTLVHEGERVRASVTLRPVGSDSTMARASALADAKSVGALTDSLTWAVLHGVWRRGKVPSPVLSGLTTASFEALRAFLDGERKFQRLDTKGALADYRRAFEADSNFAQAYLRYDYANEWSLAPADTMVTARLLALKSRLPERERLWVETREHALPLPQRVAEWKALAARYPDYPPFLMAAADQIVHNGPVYGIPINDAKPLLDRLDQLVPDHADTKMHQTIVIGRDGTMQQLADGWRAASRLMDGSTAKFSALSADLYEARATGGPLPPPDRAIALAHSFASDAAGGVLGLTSYAGLGGFFHSPVATQVDAAARVRRAGILTGELAAGAAFGESALLAARGNWTGALDAARLAESPDVSTTYQLSAVRLAALGAWLEAIDAKVADSVVRAAVARNIRGLSSIDRAELTWADGVVAVVLGDEPRLRAAIKSLAPDSNPLFRHTAGALNGLWLNRTNPAAAADSLRAVTDDVMRRGAYVLSAEAISRLLISRALRKRGENALVDRYAMWTDGGLNIPRSMAPAFAVGPFTNLERAAAFEALGKKNDAIKFYHYALDDYDQPPPAHKALIDDAKQRLVALEKLDAPKTKSVNK